MNVLMGAVLCVAATLSSGAGGEAEREFRTWSEGLLRLQVKGTGDEALDGGFLCPACAAMHGRAMELVWPFAWAWKRTGDERYLRSAEAVVTWARKNLLRPDGSIINDPNMVWRGITVFSQTALGKALDCGGDRLPQETRAEWLGFYRKMTEFLVRWMDDPATVCNPNYHAGHPLAMEYAARVLGDRGYRASGLRHWEFVRRCRSKEGLIFGEGPGPKFVTPKGFRVVDMGYNLEESIPALLEWSALLVDRPDIRAEVMELARVHADFVLPDGAIDDSFGSRAAKWTYWGGRTSDGVLPVLAALAKSGDAGAAEKIPAVLALYSSCTDPKRGLLTGGRDYVKAGELPCIHHAFCKLKTFPDFIDAPPPESGARGARALPAGSESGAPVRPTGSESSAPVRPTGSESSAPVRPTGSESGAPVRPTGSESGAPVRPICNLQSAICNSIRTLPAVMRYQTCGVTVARVVDWRATFSENDGRTERNRRESTGGGSLTLLHHRTLGPVFAANMTAYDILERLNMQTQIHSDVEPCLTPRIETADGRFLSVYDDSVSLSVAEWDGTVVATAKGHLRDEHLAEGPAFSLIWTLAPSGVTVAATCAAEARLLLPLVAARDCGLVLASASPIARIPGDRPDGRVFSSQTGFLAEMHRLDVRPGATVTVAVGRK